MKNKYKIVGAQVLKKLPLAVAISLSASAASHALTYNNGELNVQLDNTVGYGVGWRTSDRDTGTIMPGNGEVLGLSTSGASYNYDDGNLNYDKGDMYTSVFKYSADLEVSYKNYGGFFRGRAYYDTVIMDEDPEFKPYVDATKDRAGRGAELLDAYVYADFDVVDKPVNVRLGQQVLSWGESTFIQGGINSINPVDASAFRKPGAEVKEGLLPVNMLYSAVGLTSDLSMEVFYLLDWKKTESDPCGTFFSTVDFVADGCGPVILAGTESEQFYLDLRDQEIEQGTDLSGRLSPIAERLPDDKAKDDGQYGIAFRQYTDLNDGTEFGVYFMNIHSRLPYINGVVTNYASAAAPDGVAEGAQVNPNATFDTRYPLYQIAYPEDLKIMGVSFATSTPSGASIAGEISYKPDSPLQYNAFELILAGNAAPQSRLYQQRLRENEGDDRALFGELAQGYDEFDIWQAQTTWIKFVDQVFGADRLAMVAEVGMTYIPDLPDKNGEGSARYGRSGAYGIGNNEGVIGGVSADFCSETPSGTNNVNPEYCNDEGYVTKLAGGVRFRSALDYNNAFNGVTVTPKFSFAYDRGNGPEPGSQFIDERLTASVGVGFTYLSNTSVDVAYTSFSGGDYNVTKDRDNVTLSAKYSF